MTTNPYASPTGNTSLGEDADAEIRSVIRIFRLMGLFGIVWCLTVSGALISASVAQKTLLASSAVLLGVHVVIFCCCLAYMRVANRMARRERRAIRSVRIGTYLLIAGFPLFPLGLGCFPLFVIVGILCIRKVNRYYDEFCHPIDDQVIA